MQKILKVAKDMYPSKITTKQHNTKKFKVKMRGRSRPTPVYLCNRHN